MQKMCINRLSILVTNKDFQFVHFIRLKPAERDYILKTEQVPMKRGFLISNMTNINILISLNSLYNNST